MTRSAFAAGISALSLGAALSLCDPIGPAAAAEAVTLAPHRASYDVGLVDSSDNLLGVDGRIAVAMEQPGGCQSYGIDYRFVARFLKEQDIVVTDQQIRLTESRDGRHLDFNAESFVDSLPDSTTSGKATTDGKKTVVAYEEPEARDVTLPQSVFPLHHTKQIIEAAKAGVPIIESPVFQGDSDPEKNTTSTVIVTPLEAAELSNEIAGYGTTEEPKEKAAPDAPIGNGDDAMPEDGSAAPQDGEATTPDGDAETGREGPAAAMDGQLDSSPDGAASPDASDAGPEPGDPAAAPSPDPGASDPAAIAERLAGLKAWRITEAFYNSDSDENGLPVFETTYTLFENGVTGNQILKFDGYSLKARLASLEFEEAPRCPAD
ncbi:DUF1849 family protein [Jiella endophytica]|uniref:DUF1849 family protein n=1 Tax=Jiella endophytica TaxID=2558362 RepID=A0A4Y8RNR5_9HYPH|nr:DUF1849 family protein [Jiella endophytica]TFF25248.1 DUF1849 family protein [Jiella endophytica]